MTLCYLIFSPQPRELTDEQVEEAREAGHLLEVLGEKPAGPPAPPAVPADPSPAAKPQSKET